MHILVEPVKDTSVVDKKLALIFGSNSILPAFRFERWTGGLGSTNATSEPRRPPNQLANLEEVRDIETEKCCESSLLR